MLITVILLLSVFAGCSKGSDPKPQNTVTEAVPTVLDEAEYKLYQDIFHNHHGADYVGKEVTKKGTFTIIYDEYYSVVRYYVWGYSDDAKSSDWQWEIVPKSTDALPSVGSLVEVTGLFSSDEQAFDGYWIDGADITVVQPFNGFECDVDLTTMGGTLERVQFQNIQQFSDKFEGKLIRAYGRVETPTSFQHPYYDNFFSQKFETTDTVPEKGTKIIVTGTYREGVIVSSAVNETTQY